VRNRLEKAQTDRFSNTVIYALFAMLLLSLLAIAYLLARINRGPEVSGSRWFDAAPGAAYPDSTPPMPAARSVPGALQDAGSATAPSPAPLVDSGPAPLAVSQPQTDRLPIEPTQPMPHDGVIPGAATANANAQVDVSLVEMSESTFDRLMQSGATHSAIRRTHDTGPMAEDKHEQTQATASAAPRPRIDADELIDIRQRAEFFVTLGQTDQAVQVLEARIAQDGASCPQAFRPGVGSGSGHPTPRGGRFATAPWAGRYPLSALSQFRGKEFKVASIYTLYTQSDIYAISMA
jgi:hypothetical protein